MCGGSRVDSGPDSRVQLFRVGERAATTIAPPFSSPPPSSTSPNPLARTLTAMLRAESPRPVWGEGRGRGGTWMKTERTSRTEKVQKSESANW